mmetsp:Transcript_32375/g.62230  ORF Transcript_32375/g.62230 Transcript_32375/m.62230 type:complete len:387 (+) Transcript_32375:297-1457(+)
MARSVFALLTFRLISFDERNHNCYVICLPPTIGISRLTRRLGKGRHRVLVLRQRRGQGGELLRALLRAEPGGEGARRNHRDVAVKHVVEQAVRPHHHHVARLHRHHEALRVARRVGALLAQLVREVELVLLRRAAEQHLALAHHHKPAVPHVGCADVALRQRQQAGSARPLLGGLGEGGLQHREGVLEVLRLESRRLGVLHQLARVRPGVNAQLRPASHAVRHAEPVPGVGYEVRVLPPLVALVRVGDAGGSAARTQGAGGLVVGGGGGGCCGGGGGGVGRGRRGPRPLGGGWPVRLVALRTRGKLRRHRILACWSPLPSQCSQGSRKKMKRQCALEVSLLQSPSRSAHVPRHSASGKSDLRFCTCRNRGTKGTPQRGAGKDMRGT